MPSPEMRDEIVRQMERQQRLQALYEKMAVCEKTGRLSKNEKQETLHEIGWLEDEIVRRYETERKYRETLLEGIWALREKNVPEAARTELIEKLKSNVARRKQLDASVKPAEQILTVSEPLVKTIRQMQGDFSIGRRQAVQEALKQLIPLEQAIEEFHAAYGQKWIVHNMRARIETAHWSGRGNLLKEALSRIGHVLYNMYELSKRYRVPRMRPSEDSQRAESARIELNGVRAQAYYALKRIAWEKEYLLEQLTLLEDQIRNA